MMQYFYAIVHKDPGSAFGVEFPDLPGCFSAADREEDVLPNACEALELWFEDADAVQPRSLDAIRAMAATELAAGAFIVAVPLIRRTGSRFAQIYRLIAGCSMRSTARPANAS